jgi:hypothetical protein
MSAESEDPTIPDTPDSMIAGFSRVIRQPETITLLVAFGLSVGAIWILIELAEKAKSFREIIQGLVRTGFEPELTGSNEIKLWFVVSLLLLIVLPIALACYSTAMHVVAGILRRRVSRLEVSNSRIDGERLTVTSERDNLAGEKTQLTAERDSLREELVTERKRVQTTLESRAHNLQKTLDGTIRAASRIRDQMFPAVANGAGKSIEAVHYLYYINKKFDAEVHRHYRISAGDTPLHFWESSIAVSPDASPAETFVDLDFRVISHDAARDVVFLPTKNDLQRKVACYFFLPRLEPGNTREFEVAYQWPGMALQLLKQGFEEFTFRFQSAGRLRSYCLEIYLEPGSGGTLTCEEIGILLPQKTLERVSSHQGWPGWKYAAEDVPALGENPRISLRAEWIKD